MAPLPLKGGFYTARNLIANAQRCTNLYPEKNPEDSPQPFTMYQTPGLTVLGNTPAGGTWRGLYEATNGSLYGVLNQNVYYIDPNWTFTQIGGPLVSNVLSPVSFADNGTIATLVDGSPQGYQITLATNAFAQIGDPNFLGSVSSGILDTFLLYNQPGTRNFYSSLSGVVNFDPTYFAAKSGYPDKLAAIAVMHREVWLLGAQRTSEIWYNSGAAAFPFAITPGVFIEQGCAAPYSVAKHDLMIFWLGRDKDGKGTVFMGANYAARKISTPAISSLISKLPRIDDAIGMTYKQQDHVFYMLTFPSGDLTVVYDTTENLWHTRAFNDVNGVEHRHRANCMAQAYGTVVCGDFANGQLYSLDINAFTDFGNPIVRRRSFPHLLLDGKRVSYSFFRADMDCGNVFAIPAGAWSDGFSSGFGPPVQRAFDECYLRWSDDRGHSFGNPVAQSLGNTGNYIRQMQWTKLGMARDRVFELFWAAPVDTALMGAWVDPTPAGS
jgi:hypothetical protein